MRALWCHLRGHRWRSHEVKGWVGSHTAYFSYQQCSRCKFYGPSRETRVWRWTL